MLVEVLGADEIGPGQMKAVEIDGVSIVVVRKTDGTYRALRNRCAHQGAALSDGQIEPLVEGSSLGEYRYSANREVIRCPFHHFEFDVDSGESPADPRRLRVRVYDCKVQSGKVCIER